MDVHFKFESILNILEIFTPGYTTQPWSFTLNDTAQLSHLSSIVVVLLFRFGIQMFGIQIFPVVKECFCEILEQLSIEFDSVSVAWRLMDDWEKQQMNGRAVIDCQVRRYKVRSPETTVMDEVNQMKRTEQTCDGTLALGSRQTNIIHLHFLKELFYTKVFGLFNPTVKVLGTGV